MVTYEALSRPSETAREVGVTEPGTGDECQIEQPEQDSRREPGVSSLFDRIQSEGEEERPRRCFNNAKQNMLDFYRSIFSLIRHVTSLLWSVGFTRPFVPPCEPS